MLIAFAGHAGAGKTTAIEYLRVTCVCEVVYLGHAVRDEIDRRGWDRSASNERIVREELRRDEGHDAFARRSASQIREAILEGKTVFVDAIYHPSEFAVLTASIEPARAHLLAIDTALETRISRAAVRKDRPIPVDELLRRDKFERDVLDTGAVIAGAVRIGNDQTLDKLYRALDEFMRDCRR